MALFPVASAIAATVLLWPVAAMGAPENITDGELALLPPYCQDVQAIRYGNASYNPSPRAAYWVGLMGQTFWALHHYCWGLIHVRRSEAPGLPPVLRAGMLKSAINDYYYVINNGPRDFVLAPEIFLRIGEAQLSLGQVGLAHDAFRVSRELKPDYWPAYTRWIDHLLLINQKESAKQLATEGLRQSPDSAELQARFRKLGGDPSTIVPVTPPSQAASAAGAASAASATTEGPAAPASKAPAGEPKADGSLATSDRR